MVEIAALIAALATFMAAGASLIVALRTRSAVQEVHLSINSRLDKWLEVAGKQGHAAGLKEGRDEK